VSDGPDDDADYEAPDISFNGNSPGFEKPALDEDEIVLAELSKRGKLSESQRVKGTESSDPLTFL